MDDKYSRTDKRSKRHVRFSSYAEVVITGVESNPENIVTNTSHMKGFIVNSSEDGDLFTCESELKQPRPGATGVLYIDPELPSEKIFVFLVKVKWIKARSFGLEFIGGDFEDIAEYKKLIMVTSDIITEEKKR